MEGKNILQNHEIVGKRLKKISNNMYQLYKVLKAKNMIDSFFLGISHESLFFRNCNDNMSEKATGIIQLVDEGDEVFQIGFSEYHNDEVIATGRLEDIFTKVEEVCKKVKNSKKNIYHCDSQDYEEEISDALKKLDNKHVDQIMDSIFDKS